MVKSPSPVLATTNVAQPPKPAELYPSNQDSGAARIPWVGICNAFHRSLLLSLEIILRTMEGVTRHSPEKSAAQNMGFLELED